MVLTLQEFLFAGQTFTDMTKTAEPSDPPQVNKPKARDVLSDREGEELCGCC